MFGIKFSTGPFKEYSSYRSIQGVFKLQVHSRSIPATGPFKEYLSYRSIQGVFQLQVHSRSIPAPGPFKEYSSSRSIQGIFQLSFVTIQLFQRKRSYSFSHRVFCWTKPCDCDNLGIPIVTNNVAYLDSSYNKSHRNNKKKSFWCLWLLALFEPSYLVSIGCLLVCGTIYMYIPCMCPLINIDRTFYDIILMNV